ncbi:flagellar export protein FliJ [Uliginosibacterium sp. H3]|uniref:Flagellar FliJ protein n=1 Tax=Uliginosibacterium silvisoli TaxID=3114758 RepID=A0ABU6K5H4_9RHOO|nr:flagellar export protein FliJ [Uliginosibacterium sp. H3]
MSAQNNPIKTLLNHAHEKVDAATRRLGELLASEHACEVKLDMLVQYRLEYRNRFMQAAQDGIGPDAWRNYSGFIAKLDDAIALQQNIVDQSKRQTANGQQQWVHERNRMKAFDALSQRQIQQEQRQQNKQEQKMSDEYAVKNFRKEEE